MSLPWFRLYHEFAGDPVVQTMSEAMQRRLIMVFCFKQSGDLEKLEESELARAMGIMPEELAETKKVFTKKGFIGKNWEPVNWKKRQQFDHGAAKRMRVYREHERNGAVTNGEHSANARARSVSVSVSESSEEGDARGSPTDCLTLDAVRRVADAAEARWPAQNADVFVGDLCRTFDWQLVAHVLDGAYDKDPRKLPRAWVRSGCQNEFNRGWKPEDPPPLETTGVPGVVTGELPPDLEAKVREWEEQNAKIP